MAKESGNCYSLILNDDITFLYTGETSVAIILLYEFLIRLIRSISSFKAT